MLSITPVTALGLVYRKKKAPWNQNPTLSLSLAA